MAIVAVREIDIEGTKSRGTVRSAFVAIFNLNPVEMVATARLAGMQISRIALPANS